MQFFSINTKNIFKQLISFTNQLHVSVFNTIMNHFDIMTSTVWSDICTAWITVYFCRNCSENRFYQFIGTFLTTRHDCWAIQCAFFTTGYTCSDKAEAFIFKLFTTTHSIREVGITTIDNDVALI
ncbi:hypothetical protein D3C77_628850 [compost metagenome]